jgi:hypothetical protein
MALIIGLLAGLIGGAAGIFAALYAFGFFNYLGGKKSSPNALNKETVISRILALNEPTKPYHIVKGDSTDLIAEWKIADASWWGIFNKNGFRESYRANLLLDETRHSVRCFEELGSVSWSAGMSGLTPMINYNKSFFSGRVLYKKEYSVQYGIKDPSQPAIGKVYEYQFDVDEIRKPIINVVKECGWEWVPVTARRHISIQNQSPSVIQNDQQFKYCIYCGDKIPPDSAFCPGCGKKI